MMPEQSVAKGKQILADLINALGGPGYTEVRESQCQGRRVLFGHNGEPTAILSLLITVAIRTKTARNTSARAAIRSSLL